MPMCGATREPVNDTGWHCDGTDLVQLNGIRVHGVPVVIRANLLDQVGKGWFEHIEEYGIKPFEGGDHCHVRLDARDDATKH